MKKKSTEPTPEYDSQRETRVLLEEMNKSIKTIAEQHGSIKQEIGQIKDTMEKRFNQVEMAVVENSKAIKGIGIKINGLENKLDTVIADHENRLHKLEVTH